MEDDGKASSPSVALASPPSSRPSPSSASSQAPSSSAAAPSINMFYSMERDDFNGGGAANTLGVMEGEDHDLGAEAFADMAMGGIDMSMELNALQIRAFLARNEASNENNGSNTASNVAAASQAQERRNTQEIAQRQTQKPEASAYEALRNGAVHYSRKEDKMKALQEHPAVTSVSTDGRTVGCKCGRNVRLNPPWYILKFDQHVASRNCTFLRQSKASINSGKKKRKLDATKDTTQNGIKGAFLVKSDGMLHELAGCFLVLGFVTNA
ncbi:hypothetical protein PHYBOEH_009977 [Phytophthora boehmeriae]|uniref:Uncharacterized protein n=1 Tax=Phytophthora boehmeriae TaxID=109152 RepID=A0A8T1X1A1_9STRA|nr:hypothetical protein PHYBOEH_009977 [Phytophthora boehmeriae]